MSLLPAAQPRPDLLSFLRLIPLDWRCPSLVGSETVYRADGGGLSVVVIENPNGMMSVQIVIATLGFDCTVFTNADEVPFLIRRLIGKLAHASLDRMSVDEVKACVPPWAADHVCRYLDDEMLAYQRTSARIQEMVPALLADSHKRLCLKVALTPGEETGAGEATGTDAEATATGVGTTTTNTSPAKPTP